MMKTFNRHRCCFALCVKVWWHFQHIYSGRAGYDMLCICITTLWL